MSPRLRFYVTVLLVAATSIGFTLLVLTSLDHRLGDPAVLHFDLLVQARIHAAARPWLTGIMLALTWLGAIKIFAVALGAAVAFLAWRGRAHQAVLLGGAIATSFVLNEALKQHFRRPRPQVPWSIGDEHTFSFPSGHSLFAVVLYGTLAYLALHRNPGKGRQFMAVALAILMPVGIGVSRIYLGMHFPTDVAAGWLAGGLWLGAVVMMDKAWQMRARSLAMLQGSAPTQRQA